jgi:hypothetical protein
MKIFEKNLTFFVKKTIHLYTEAMCNRLHL